MPSVVLDRVTRIFRGRDSAAVTAVAGVSLEVRDGECLALLGPSGSGKTTILRLLAGVDAPTSGEVRIAGQSQRDVPPEERGAAMVFQDHPLLPHLVVARQLSLVLGLACGAHGNRTARLGEAVRWLGLDDLLERLPGQLSGGERQRVALALAVLRQPRLLLLDEPLAHVDAPHRNRLRADLLRLRRTLGWTVLLVTHDQHEAALLADRVAILHQGRLLQCAPYSDLIAEPADTQVAAFVGSPPMNLFRGTLQSDAEGGLLFRSESGWSWPLPSNIAPAAGTSSRLVLGVRDRHLRVVVPAASTTGIPSRPQALVESVQRSADGESATLVMSLDGETVLARSTADTAPAGVGAGTVVQLEPDLRHAHWFEAETGRRYRG